MISFLIEPSSNVQITRTGIKSQTSSILAHSRPLALGLPAHKGLIGLGKCCPDDSDSL